MDRLANNFANKPPAAHRSETTDRKNTMGMAQKRTSTCVNAQPRRADPAAENRLMSELLGLGLGNHTADFQPQGWDWSDSPHGSSPLNLHAYAVPKFARRSDKLDE